MPRRWDGASNSLPSGSCPLERTLLPLPQPRCSLQRERCGFKALVPDPQHTRAFVLSLHSQCQAVTSTTVPGTRCSLQRRETGARGRGRPRESTNPAVFQEDESLPRTSSVMLYLLPLRWYGGRLPCPSSASLDSATPLIRRGHWGVHGEWESCPLVAFSCLQFNEITLCEDFFYERLVYL